MLRCVANAHPNPRRDGVYRAIRLLMAIDVALGLALAALGAFLLEVRAIAIAGLGLAAVGAALFLFFAALGRRAAGRGAAAALPDPSRPAGR